MPLLIGGETYHSRSETAALLHTRPETLSRWKARHFGPPVTSISGRDYYSEKRLCAWVAAQTVDPAEVEKPRRGRRRAA